MDIYFFDLTGHSRRRYFRTYEWAKNAFDAYARDYLKKTNDTYVYDYMWVRSTDHEGPVGAEGALVCVYSLKMVEKGNPGNAVSWLHLFKSKTED